MTITEAVAKLEAGPIPAADLTFATSLLTSYRAGRCSDKQAYWLVKLADRVGTDGKRAQTAIGDLSGIKALFDRAARRLKRPAIVIGLAGRAIKLNVAGAKARVPGSINVLEAPARHGDEVTGEPVWFGRILDGGIFEASPRVETPVGLTADLQAFAKDPATVAGAYGRMTGKCCFCNLPLTDQRSTSVGYGQTCAGNYGLPWGTKATAARQFEAA